MLWQNDAGEAPGDDTASKLSCAPSEIQVTHLLHVPQLLK